MSATATGAAMCAIGLILFLPPRIGRLPERHAELHTLARQCDGEHADMEQRQQRLWELHGERLCERVLGERAERRRGTGEPSPYDTPSIRDMNRLDVAYC